MLKTSIIILTIVLIFSALYSLGLIFTPQTFAANTFEARSGETLETLQAPGAKETILAQTQYIGVMAICLVIALFFILFTAFKNKETWAWWVFLIIWIIAWGYGVVSQLSEGDKLNSTLQIIGFILDGVGVLLPVKLFFAKQEG